MRGYAGYKPDRIVDVDTESQVEKRADEIARDFENGRHLLDFERIRAVDVRVRNMYSGVEMWSQIVLDEIADSSLANLDAAREEIDPLLDYLRRKVWEVEQTYDQLQHATLPEVQALYAIIKAEKEPLQEYVITLTEIREIIVSLQTNPELAAQQADSAIYQRLTQARQLFKTQFETLARFGNELQATAAYKAYTRYITANQMENIRLQPVDARLLSESESAAK